MKYLSRLAARARSLGPSPIRKLAPLMKVPGMVSLGGGYPNPETFVFDSIDVNFKSGKHYTIGKALIGTACQYGVTNGAPDLISFIQQWHEAKDGVQLSPQQILLLNGAQEGLHMMAYLLLEPEDAVALSEPAYPGALGAFRAFCRNFISAPIDENGLVTSNLEELLKARKAAGLPSPKFIYETPNGHNPAGVRLSLERRHDLIRIASEYDCLILEDDPYQLLQLEDHPPLPTLQSLDSEGRVVRLDSFSKIFAPGLRLGYVSGPSEIISYLCFYKQGTNLHTSSMDQTFLTGFFERHSIPEFRELIRENCRLYRRNRDVMVAAAQRRLPAAVKFAIPTEGMFLWFKLPSGYNADRMVEQDGLDLGVLLVPGSAFSPSGGLSNCMRASYSMVTPQQIELGIERFAVMIERERVRIEAH